MAEAETTVMYRGVVGYEMYRVGDDGTIWSRHWGRWRQLRTHPDRHGYLRIKLCRDGMIRLAKLHKLVAEAFLGPCPKGMEVAHNDGVRVHCELKNLRYDTHRGNLRDCIAHGTSNAGETNGSSKLTEAQVLDMLARAAAGEAKGSLMLRFGVGRRAVERILRGDRWGHLRRPSPGEARSEQDALEVKCG